MAVYTHLSNEALRRHLRPFRLGELLRARGVSAGTINTIYDVKTSKGHYILRILEDRSATDARFEEALLARLSENDMCVPRMMAGRRGAVIEIAPRQQLSVFEYLPGRELGVFEVEVSHARQIGTFLAELHAVAKAFGRRRRNRFTPERVQRIADLCLKWARRSADDEVVDDIEVLRGELGRAPEFDELPGGIIHGDLFIDNARFSRGKLCGVLDFEMASNGPLAYDVAVAIGDWAFCRDGLDLERATAVIAGYGERRSLTTREKQVLFDLSCFSAARYAITRIYDFDVRTRPEAQRLYKDYRHFMARLRSLKRIGARAFKRALFEGKAAQTGVRAR